MIDNANPTREKSPPIHAEKKSYTKPRLVDMDAVENTEGKAPSYLESHTTGTPIS